MPPLEEDSIKDVVEAIVDVRVQAILEEFQMVGERVLEAADTITTHATLVSGNPHQVTKEEVGLSNVLNAAQVLASTLAQPNGPALLDSNGKVPESQLPVLSSFTIGDKVIFCQSAVPTKWVLDTSINDRMLRVSSSLGGGIGGSWGISGITVGSHALSINEMPRHKHGIVLGHEQGGTNDATGWPNTDSSGPLVEHTEGQPDGSSSDNTGAGNPLYSIGGSQPHSHTLTVNNEWRPAFVDVIIGVYQG